MIVELFGPPGAGKTTLCHALARQLGAGGVPVQLWVSQRPAEPSPHDAGPTTERAPPALAAARRVLRPLVEFAVLAASPHDLLEASRRSSALVACLPPSSPWQSMRVGQYLRRLDAAWRRAERSDAVTVFDQAFVQTVLSLACTARTADARMLDRALDAIPRPDVLVCVDAPLPVIERRLRERRDRQGRIERSLEHAARFGFAERIVLDRLRSCIRGRCQAVHDVEGGLRQEADVVALLGTIRTLLRQGEQAPARRPVASRIDASRRRTA